MAVLTGTQAPDMGEERPKAPATYTHFHQLALPRVRECGEQLLILLNGELRVSEDRGKEKGNKLMKIPWQLQGPGAAPALNQLSASPPQPPETQGSVPGGEAPQS